jgi:hypothetical protein
MRDTGLIAGAAARRWRSSSVGRNALGGLERKPSEISRAGSHTRIQRHVPVVHQGERARDGDRTCAGGLESFLSTSAKVSGEVSARDACQSFVGAAVQLCPPPAAVPTMFLPRLYGDRGGCIHAVLTSLTQAGCRVRGQRAAMPLESFAWVSRIPLREHSGRLRPAYRVPCLADAVRPTPVPRTTSASTSTQSMTDSYRVADSGLRQADSAVRVRGQMVTNCCNVRLVKISNALRGSYSAERQARRGLGAKRDGGFARGVRAYRPICSQVTTSPPLKWQRDDQCACRTAIDTKLSLGHASEATVSAPSYPEFGLEFRPKIRLGWGWDGGIKDVVREASRVARTQARAPVCDSAREESASRIAPLAVSCIYNTRSQAWPISITTAGQDAWRERVAQPAKIAVT